MIQTNEWYVVSSRGSVLFYIALHPGCTIPDLTDAMSLTRRSVWGIVSDLRRAGMITTTKKGRRSHYTVNMEASFLHPTLPDFPLSMILGELVSRRESLMAEPVKTAENESEVANGATPVHSVRTIDTMHRICTNTGSVIRS